MLYGLKQWAYGVVFVSCLVSIWELLVVTMSSAYFPSISELGIAFIEMIISGEFFVDSIVSLRRVLFGFLIGSVFGILTGLGTSTNKQINDLISPSLHFLRYLPLVALVPLAILWFGIGELSKIIIIALAVFFPVWLNTHSGINHLPRKYLLRADNLELSTREKTQNILLRGSLPSIFNGIRLGLGVGFVLLVIAEMAGAYSGLGFRIDISYLLFRIDKVIVIIFFLGIIGILSDKLLVIFGKWTFPWLKEELK